MFEPAIAPSASLLGLLQRGRGDGTLHALAAERADALAALEHCVTCDPRRDWQVENRSLYYARLYMELEAPLQGLEEHLLQVEDMLDEHECRTGLALAVLGRLAGYGRRDALLLLRRYAAVGSNWAWALDELALWDDDEALRDLATPVLARFAPGPEGDAALRAAVREAYEPRPWHLWALTHPRVAAATEQAPFDLWQRQLDRSATAPAWSTPAVLAWADEQGPTPQDVFERRVAAAARCLAAVAAPADRPLLLEAATSAQDGARCAALRHLVDHDDECAPDLVELAAADTSHRTAAFALGALARMRGARITERARVWAADPEGGPLADAAGRLLAAVGQPADGPLVVAALRRGIFTDGVDGEGLAVLVEGVGRLAATTAVPVLRHIYAETSSSQLRGSAARSLSGLDPCFPTGAAVECLWDCEEATRELAARHVLTKGDGKVLDRLRRLAADPGEEAEVHAAVRGRLSSG
ncbi:HEAT repeat domain-containing protein [Streptacidiphilus sp. P02-A3a]|uniref:HEAT repeat domain-containing protein n=1 Tax=Streptacidiphilus sp. P02-A3a TaxID=2704468 RepID=UPI0015F9147C|nr:HEAT repeat domain-containing protein [Streptacidiphilus sp. P02-A3a]QMU70839.1 HEAT repeat domain-containing protein [Streptacidiphilus sp. P02-A3a]